MGNTTVTPAAPAMAPTPIVTTVRRISVFVLDSDVFHVSPESPTPRNFVHPSIVTSVSPINSPIPTMSGSSIGSTSPTNLDNSTAPLISTIPVASATVNISTTPVIPITTTNFSPMISPDTSAVSPTFDIPPTSIKSPTSTIAVKPVDSIISFNVIHSAAPIKPTTHVISTSPLPIKVAPKRTASQISVPLPTRTIEQKHQENSKEYFRSAEHTQSLNILISSPTNPDNHQKDTPIIRNITATPSFSLRSTAVCNFSQDNDILPEGTQSSHKDISIFKYYLTQKEIPQSSGNHSKATMFKMNTRLKQTPLPTPSLLFFTTNFNDGIHEIDANSTTTPTFSSLGLGNNLETDSIELYPTKFHLLKNEQQKSSPPSLFSGLDATANNSSQIASSTVNLSSLDKCTSVQGNRPPLISILKKRTSQSMNKTVSLSTNMKAPEEFQKNKIENYSSTVSFKILSPKKASQSISRSIKLFST